MLTLPGHKHHERHAPRGAGTYLPVAYSCTTGPWLRQGCCGPPSGHAEIQDLTRADAFILVAEAADGEQLMVTDATNRVAAPGCSHGAELEPPAYGGVTLASAVTFASPSHASGISQGASTYCIDS